MEAEARLVKDPPAFLAWFWVNQIKGGELVFLPSAGEYLAKASYHRIPARVAGYLAGKGYIEPSGNGSGPVSYRISQLGRKLWGEGPEEVEIRGECDHCRRVRDLAPFKSRRIGRYLMICNECLEAI